LDDISVPEKNATARRNIIGETVDELSSIFLKNEPVVRLIPFQPHHTGLSDDIDAMWLWQWKESFGQVVGRALLEDSEITGLSAVKIYWDYMRGARHQPGGVVIRSVPMSTLYVDPTATNEHRGYDTAYIIEHMRRFPEEIAAKYGKDAEVALGWRGNRGRASAQQKVAWQMLNMNNEQLTARVDGKNTFTQHFPPLSSAGLQDDSGKVDLYECWLFPDKLYGADLTSGDNVAEQYRFGIVATMVNNRIIRVRPNPFAQRARLRTTNQQGQVGTADNWIGHGVHPYVFLHWRRIADKEGNRRFYDTMSMIEWMVSLQFNVNALRRNLAIILRTLANPMLAYNEDALATPASQIVAAPGQMLKVRGRFRLDEAIKILGPTQMPPQAQQMIAEDIQAIKDAGGVKPGVAGLFPAPGGGTSHTSGDVIGSLQQAAFGGLWKYVEGVGFALEDIARRYRGLMQLFFKEGHYMAASKRQQVTQVEWTGDHRAAQFRSVVVSGATTPIYDMQREEREGLVKQMTDQALVGGDPRIVRSTIIFLEHMNFPWTADYVQLLEEELQQLQAIQEGRQAAGAFSVLSGGQGQGALAPEGQQPLQVPQGDTGSVADLEELAASMGVSTEQLLAAAAGS
jgi:hypothetical protein